MHRQALFFVVSVALVLGATVLFATALRPTAILDDAPTLVPAPRIPNSFVRDPARVTLPTASVDSLPLVSQVVDDPTQGSGTIAGRFYAAFETSWFQPDGKSEIWWMTGPGSSSLWELWETERRIPYGPEHPEFDPHDSRPLEKWFWPYVCVETTLRGEWEYEPEAAAHVATVHAQEILKAVVVDLPLEECIPANFVPKVSR